MHTFSIDNHTLASLPINPGAPGEPIVLLHGVNLSLRSWLTDDVFVRHGPCHALTLPGHYPAAFPTTMPDSAFTPELFVRLLSAAIRAVAGEQPVTLVGISTGGFAALALAARAPELVRRVVCISGFAEGRWSGLLGRYQRWARAGVDGYRLFRLFYLFSRIGQRAYRRNVWPYFVADRAAFYRYPKLDALMDGIYPDWTRQPMEAVLTYHRRMFDLSIADWLPHVAAPTLVLHGACDPVVPLRQARLIAAQVPHAELAIFSGAGHMLFAERPNQYHATINAWMHRTAAP